MGSVVEDYYRAPVSRDLVKPRKVRESVHVESALLTCVFRTPERAIGVRLDTVALLGTHFLTALR